MTSAGAGLGFERAKAAVATDSAPMGASPAAAAGSFWPSLWRLAAGAGALAAGGALRGGRPKTPAAPTLNLVPTEAEVPTIAMHSDGGRRKRLGVGGRVCMLTGAKKHKGITRTFSEKANKRYFRPNTRWKKMWWAREQKWVRLYVSCRAIRMVDSYGLEYMARQAGLDLYAWSKPHWMPGSHQPLALRVGYTHKARNDRRLWPDYLPKLNKGAALADITPSPAPRMIKAGVPKPLKVKKLGTPPKTPPKPLQASKILKIPADQAL